MLKSVAWNVVDRMMGWNQREFGDRLYVGESMTLGDLRDYQLAKIIDICRHWGLHIYSWNDFEALPLTSKRHLPTTPPAGNYSTQTTSGSTGEPRTIYIPWETWHRKDAVFHRSWNRLGRKPHHKVLRLIAGEPEYPWYDWLRNDHVLCRDRVEEAAAWIIENRPYLIHGAGLPIREILEQVIWMGYAHILADLHVEWCSVSSAGHKQRIEPFVAGFFEQYGLAELPTVASPCKEGKMHLVMETGYTEIVNGEIVITDFLNNVTPVIRYQTGDEGNIIPASRDCCRCGLPSPVLTGVRGRRCDYYQGQGVKRPVGWWVVSPLGHNYPCVKGYYLDIYPLSGDAILNVQIREGWTEEMATQDLEPYARWFEKELGLRLLCNFRLILEPKEFKRHLVRVYE